MLLPYKTLSFLLDEITLEIINLEKKIALSSKSCFAKQFYLETVLSNSDVKNIGRHFCLIAFANCSIFIYFMTADIALPLHYIQNKI
jgi:hypothetical protein